MSWLLAFLLTAHAGDDVVLDALVAEVDATIAAWDGEPDAPYFVGYRAVEHRHATVGAIAGTLDQVPRWDTTRTLDVVARVGDHAVDSTRRLRGERTMFGFSRSERTRLPVDDDLGVLRHVVWKRTEDAVRQARERIVRVRANRSVMLDETEATTDFSREDPVVDLRPPPELTVDLDAWAPTLTDLSLVLADEPLIVSHEIALMAETTTEWLVSSEGTRIRQPRVHLRLSAQAEVKADDGMQLRLYRWTDVSDPSRLPGADELAGWVRALRQDALDLRAAPAGEPWSGPVLLRGRAAGVFVHEVIGHRVEGHRQKDEDEGQTFAGLVGTRVTHPTISIVDDPTLATYAGFDLNGHYAYDQEGVPAQPAPIVEDGVFRGFLMSRSPIPGFDRSNGHGRAQVGRPAVARMANTILSTTDPLDEAALRRRMREEIRRSGAPYGLIVDELAGGFTLTGRVMPNTFNIRAVTAWRIYADGRGDELVRGVDLVGTPLDALDRIIAAGDDPGVFNGYCGAESGSVPNAAVSPSLLLRSLEIQKKETEVDRPPLLRKPGLPGGDS